jgi:hypothetical protein
MFLEMLVESVHLTIFSKRHPRYLLTDLCRGLGMSEIIALTFTLRV